MYIHEMFTYEKNFSRYTKTISEMKGCFNLPSNKKEEIIFGLMMVFGMVSIMFAYNITLEGLWRK